MFILGTLPFLAATFGMLYIFYQFFHPWKSEGVSVGFEPRRDKREDTMRDAYELGDYANDTEQQGSNQPKGYYGTFRINNPFIHAYIYIYVDCKILLFSNDNKLHF